MKSLKQYIDWGRIKFSLNKKKRPFINEREVWFCYLGINIGHEQDGKGVESLRPVIVFRKFNNMVCLIIPLTKNMKDGKYYFSFRLSNRVLNNAILSQLRLVDSKRFIYKYGTISHDEFSKLKQRLKKLIF